MARAPTKEAMRAFSPLFTSVPSPTTAASDMVNALFGILATLYLNCLDERWHFEGQMSLLLRRLKNHCHFCSTHAPRVFSLPSKHLTHQRSAPTSTPRTKRSRASVVCFTLTPTAPTVDRFSFGICTADCQTTSVVKLCPPTNAVTPKCRATPVRRRTEPEVH